MLTYASVVRAPSQVSSTHLPVSESGAPRGFGFVTFTTDATAQRVIKTYVGNPLGQGKQPHSLRWASVNLQPLPASDSLVDGTTFDLGGGVDASELHTLGAVPSASAAAGGGSAAGSSPLGPASCACTCALPSMASNTSSHGNPLANAAAAQVARAQELHLQAQAAGLHSVEARLEMASHAQRMLEAVVATLTSVGPTGGGAGGAPAAAVDASFVTSVG